MENALNLPPSDGSRIPRGQLLHLLAQASTLKMESLWRGRDELPGEFMADLIFRVKPARSEPLSHSTLPYVVFSPNNSRGDFSTHSRRSIQHRFACQVGVHANLNPVRRHQHGKNLSSSTFFLYHKVILICE